MFLKPVERLVTPFPNRPKMMDGVSEVVSAVGEAPFDAASLQAVTDRLDLLIVIFLCAVAVAAAGGVCYLLYKLFNYFI